LSGCYFIVKIKDIIVALFKEVKQLLDEKNGSKKIVKISFFSKCLE